MKEYLGGYHAPRYTTHCARIAPPGGSATNRTISGACRQDIGRSPRCVYVGDRLPSACLPSRQRHRDTVASAVVARPSSQTTCMRPRRLHPAPATRSAFAGFRFPPDVIVLAVRWYLRFGLSYRDVEELLAERGIEVDHVTVYRWVQRFTPLLAEAARPAGTL